MTSICPPTSLHQWSAALSTSQSGRAVGGRQKVYWKHSFGHDSYRGAIYLLFPDDQLSSPPLLPANWAVFKQLRQNSKQVVHFPLCFVAPSSGGRGGQRKKQTSLEYSCEDLTLPVAVLYPFWPSLRQFHFPISAGEHPGPRLTLLQRILCNKTQRPPGAGFSKQSFPSTHQSHTALCLFYQLMSQLLIETSSNSFMPSICPTPGIISLVFSALQARKELRWGEMVFISKEACSSSKLEGGTRNTVLRRKVRSEGVTSSYQRQSHLALPHSQASSSIPLGVWLQPQLL